MNSLEKVARRLLRLEREVRHLGTTPQLAYSSLEDGSIHEYDADGDLVSIIGEQYDGTHTHVTMNGPTPPTPTAPVLTPAPGGVVVKWLGTFEDDAVIPLNYTRMEVHASLVPDFDAQSFATLKTVVASPRGGEVTVPLRVYEPHYFKLVARNESGLASAASAQAVATPDKIGNADIKEFAVAIINFHSNQHQIF